MKFEKPIAEIIYFENEDIIVTSGEGNEKDPEGNDID